MILAALGLAAVPFWQGPIKIGVYGEVKSPGLRTLAEPTLEALSDAIAAAEPRPNASPRLLLCRADGKLQMAKLVGDGVEWATTDGSGGVPHRPAHGDLVYVSALSSAVVVEKGKARHVAFEGPTVPLTAIVPSTTGTPKAVALPRFFERFPAPDLVGEPEKLVFDLVSQRLPMGAGAAATPADPWEPVHWIARTDGLVRAGDLVIVEGAEPYAALAATAKPATERDWLRSWTLAAWNIGDPFPGAETVPIATGISEENQPRRENLDMLVLGPYDSRPSTPDGSWLRLLVQSRSVGAGRPIPSPVGSERKRAGRYEIERADRTRVFVHRLDGNGTLVATELNSASVRNLFDLAPLMPGTDPMMPANLQIDKENNERRRNLRGARVANRLYVPSFASFFVDLELMKLAQVVRPQEGGLWRASSAMYANYEQESIHLDPKKNLPKAAKKQKFWVYSGVLKLQSLKDAGTSVKGLKMATVPLKEIVLPPSGNPATNLPSGALILRTGVAK